jgi:hypothetical protein
MNVTWFIRIALVAAIATALAAVVGCGRNNEMAQVGSAVAPSAQPTGPAAKPAELVMPSEDVARRLGRPLENEDQRRRATEDQIPDRRPVAEPR